MSERLGGFEFMEQIKQIEVMHLDGFGIGPVVPTEHVADSEVANEVMRTQEAVQRPEIVCVDERQSVLGEQPVRRKTAGGAGMSGFEGAVLANWYLLPELGENANDVFAFVVDKLDVAKVALGGHIDNHANLDDAGNTKTNCGATDGAPAANQRIAELGHSEFEPKVMALMGDDFDQEMFKKVVAQAQRLEDIRFFANWNPVEAMKVVRSKGVVEILDGDNSVPDADPNRHGHYAEGVNFNTTPGFSNNRDHTNIPYFQLDKEAVDEIANKLARNEDEARQIRHGIYTYNVAIVYGLTQNQRLTIS